MTEYLESGGFEKDLAKTEPEACLNRIAIALGGVVGQASMDLVEKKKAAENG